MHESGAAGGLVLESSECDAGRGRHATSLILQWQVDGVDADFGHNRPVVLAGQTVGPFTAGQTVNFPVRAANSAGTTESAVKTITLT